MHRTTKILQKTLSTALFILEIGLITRFVLRLVGVMGGSLYEVLMAVTQPAVQPFVLFFPSPAVRGSMTIEFAVLAAAFCYAIAGYVVQEILRFFGRRSVVK